ncbi:MAG: hypothetical protein B6I20_05595 [Bacteroidetes bacterium 4572_117]|nr:MAG: hypothetical protein B6I20_05595 [Bacteroidetes bacterium 4572_117]
MKAKFIFSFLTAMLLAVVSGLFIATAVGIPPAVTVPVLTVASFIPKTQGVLNAGVYTEVWVGEVVKAFKVEGSFLAKVPQYDRYVKNDVIHLVEIGAKPEVLINNTTYPLTPQALGDSDIPIGLDKLETVPTAITKDELYAISYAKIQAAIELHKDSLIESALNRAIHAFAPAADATGTPVVRSTGGNNGNTFNRVLIADLIKLKRKFDDLKIPNDGNRILVLCPQHVEDLLLVSESFQKQYQDIKSGKVLNLYGFEIHEYVNMPKYDGSFDKKAFGAAAAGTDRDASVAFYAKRMFRAKGSADMSYSEAKKDPLNKRNLVSFDQRFIALPKTQEAIGAIVNDTFS